MDARPARAPRTALTLCAASFFARAAWAAHAPQAPPGALFNLTSFKLQLPISDGKGGVVEVLQPALATYTSQFFCAPRLSFCA